MAMTTETFTADRHATAGVFTRLFAPFVAIHKAYRETERTVAEHLLDHDDSTLHILGYRRADLKAGVVRSIRAD